ncbi:Vacuolar protein sorting-associated protein 8 [Thoreauomyces humboldtii]|nr:Vacuolar protein sorting-associated protein 8 [Thoreauomyces humboldtii]
MSATQPTVDYVVRGDWVGTDDIVAAQWLDEKFLVLLTSHQSLISFDVVAMQEVERTEALSRKIVSADFQPQTLRTKGIVPTLSMHQSFKSFKGKVFILGERDLTVASRLSWTDRIKALVVYGHFEDAIAMGLKFYNGQLQHAVTGLPREEDSRKELVGNHLAELLMTHIDMSLASYEAAERKLQEGEDLNVYRQLAVAAFDTCLAISREDLLFGDIYEQFTDKELGPVFLELLETYILDERVTGFSNPIMVQEFMSHYEQHEWFDRLEQVILHLDPTGLDVHRTVGTCLKHHMHSALIYIYTRVGDFVMPIVELLRLIDSKPNDTEQADARRAQPDREGAVHSIPETASVEGAVYTLYVYLAYVLTGKAFPVGILGPDEAVQAKQDVYSFLLSPLHASWPPGASTQNLGQERFPYIRLLYQHDPREFLKVVAAMLSDNALDSNLLRIRDNVFIADRDGLGRYTDRYEISRQFIMDSLFTAVEGETPPQAADLLEGWPDSAALNVPRGTLDLYCFAARNFARFGESFTLGHAVLRRIVLSLALSSDPSAFHDRQHAILAILASGFEPSEAPGEAQKFVEIYEHAKLWQVRELVARRQGQYELVLRCYLEDPSRRRECFSVLRKLVLSGTLSVDQREAVKQSLLEQVEDLLSVDNVETANLVTALWPTEHRAIFIKLADKPTELFNYLKGLLDPVESVSEGEAAIASETSVIGPVATDIILTLPEEIYEQYITFLCERQPRSVKPYLERLFVSQAGYPYDFEKVSAACKANHIIDGASWILEQSGDLEGALGLILESIREGILGDEPWPDPPDESETVPAGKVQVVEGIELGLQLCRRNSSKLNKQDRENLWFRMLNAMVELHHLTATPKEDAQESGAVIEIPGQQHDRVKQQLLKSTTREILYSMVGHVVLHSIILRIVQAQPTAPFGEHRRMIFSMLESYTYERELLEATTRILTEDAHACHVRSLTARSHALRPARGQCAVCRRLLHVRALVPADMGDRVVVLACGHAFHAVCLQREMNAIALREEWTVPSGSVARGTAWCTMCSKTPGSSALAAVRKRAELGAAKSKGKEKLVSLADLASDRGLKPPADPDQSLPAKMTKADLFLQLSTQTASSSLYTLLAPRANPGDSRNVYDEDAGEIDYGDLSLHSDQSHSHSYQQDHHGLAPTSFPPNLTRNPDRNALALAPPTPRDSARGDVLVLGL